MTAPTTASTPTATSTTPAAPATSGEQRTPLEIARFDEQAFLTYNIRKLAVLHKNRHDAETKYTKLDLLKGPNVALINRLLNADFFQKEPVLTLTPAQISELVPQLRLFKQNLNSSKDVVSESEFVFPAYISPNQVLGDLGRSGYGIQSLQIETLGTTEYTADKQFNVTMVLYFQTFDEFVRQRGNYSFLELVLQSPPASGPSGTVSSPAPAAVSSRHGAISDPHSFRVRVQFGWSLGQISANSTFSRKSDAALIKAIERSKLSMMLYPYENDFSINDDGTLTVTIKYTGGFDVISRDYRSGIILTQDQRSTLDAITQQINIASKSNNPEGVEKLRKNLAAVKTSLMSEAMQSIVKQLHEPEFADNKSKVYQLAISREAMNQFALLGGVAEQAPEASLAQSDSSTGQAVVDPAAALAAGPPVLSPIDFCNLPLDTVAQDMEDSGFVYPILDVVQAPEETLTIEEFKTQAIIKDATGNEYSTISWFYFGDLLEVLMHRAFNENAPSAENLARTFGSEFSKRVKMILSDIEIFDYCSGTPIRLNLAHVPISLKKFNTFFYNKVVTTGNTEYTISDFVKDALSDLVQDVFLSRAYIANRSLSQKMNLKSMNLAVYSNSPKTDVLTPVGDVVRVESLSSGKFLKSSGVGSNPNNYFFYLMIYQDTFDPSKLIGNYASDRGMGIPHIYMGRDRGIVKKTTFQRIPIIGKREERIQGIGTSFDLVSQLTSLYNVTMETYGTTIFLLGSYFYLVPTGMGTSLGLPNVAGSLSNIMGLGGYYLANKIDWSIESGKYTTKIVAIHQATGGGDVPSGKIARGNAAAEGITD